MLRLSIIIILSFILYGQAIEGVDFAAYQKNQSVYVLSIQESAAASIGCQSSDVNVTSILEKVGSFRSLNFLASTSSIIAQYSVTLVNPLNFGYSSVEAAILGMSNNLNTAIADGEFTNALVSSADKNKATGFASAKSTQAATTKNLSPTFPPSQSPIHSSTSESLTSSAIGGITVVLIIAGIFISLIVAWYFIRKTFGGNPT
jgi:hypothetical protein